MHVFDFCELIPDDKNRSCLDNTLLDNQSHAIESLNILESLKYNTLSLSFSDSFKIFSFLNDQLWK